MKQAPDRDAVFEKYIYFNFPIVKNTRETDMTVALVLYHVPDVTFETDTISLLDSSSLREIKY